MKYAIVTLGCKVNQYETQAIETLLQARGFSPAERDADVAIVNTCAVTAESVRKSRQAARRLRGLHPNALLALCGCFSQLSPQDAADLGADLIFGSGERAKLVQAIETRLSAAKDPEKISVGHAPLISVPERGGGRQFEELPAGSVSGRTRAMLKIQDGCDNFCTYCVIPYARGRSRSLPLARAAEMAADLKRRDYREIVLTGIEIASYGRDLPGGPELADCVEAVAKAADGLRIRLGSLEPTVVSRDFCRRLRELGNVCGHFHLSLQSGCDATLRAMGRKYDTARFLACTQLLREFFPNCALGADLIAGFPGETEGDFEQTLTFLATCAFAFLHVFPYSIRPGTRAAALPGQLGRAEKARRAEAARALAARMKAAYLRGCVGKTLPVLFESEADGYCAGHGDNYCQVRVPGEHLRGLVGQVEIEGVSGEVLVGKTVSLARPPLLR